MNATEEPRTNWRELEGNVENRGKWKQNTEEMDQVEGIRDQYGKQNDTMQTFQNTSQEALPNPQFAHSRGKTVIQGKNIEWANSLLNRHLEYYVNLPDSMY